MFSLHHPDCSAIYQYGGNIDTSYPEDRAKIIRVIAGIANNINQAVKLGNSFFILSKSSAYRFCKMRKRSDLFPKKYKRISVYIIFRLGRSTCTLYMIWACEKTRVFSFVLLLIVIIIAILHKKGIVPLTP